MWIRVCIWSTIKTGTVQSLRKISDKICPKTHTRWHCEMSFDEIMLFPCSYIHSGTHKRWRDGVNESIVSTCMTSHITKLKFQSLPPSQYSAPRKLELRELKFPRNKKNWILRFNFSMKKIAGSLGTSREKLKN